MSEITNDARPNIVFFIVDQLAAKWLEGQSAGAIPTPNLDRLRERGVSFTQAIVSNPVCMASRSTLATGLPTRQHGVLQNGYQLDPELPTFMRLLQQAGWRTGALGKVHLQPHFRGVHPDYRGYGFDVTHITEDARAGEWLDWVKENHPEAYDNVLATIWPTKIPEIQRYGEEEIDLGERIQEIRADFSWSTPEFPQNTPRAYTLPFDEEVSQTAWITGHALDFIRATDPAQPICAHISYVQPHSPFTPPAEYMAYVDVEQIPEPAPAEWLTDPRRPTCFLNSESAEPHIPENWRERRHYYFADIVHLDHQLGRVVDALAESGRLDNTYLIFLSDHGEMLMDHGFSGKGERHYDACVRVPLIIAGPGLRQKAACNELVQLEDIFPTVLEMAGLPLPTPTVMGPYMKDAVTDARAGRSLMPLARGEYVSDWRSAAYVESFNNIDTNTPRNWARTVRTREWRYTMYPDGNGEQLFNLRVDPDEQENLVCHADHQQIRQQLRDRLLDLIILQDYPHTPRSLFSLGVH